MPVISYVPANGLGKISNAELMAQTAAELGVPRNKIRIEPKSKNTREHAVEFNKLFTNKDFTIGLVTSACHMKRSEREFRKYFNNVLPLPSDYLYSSPVTQFDTKVLFRNHIACITIHLFCMNILDNYGTK